MAHTVSIPPDSAASPSVPQPAVGPGAPATWVAPSSPTAHASGPQPQLTPQGCVCDDAEPEGYVYSVGDLAVRFPDRGTEREFEFCANREKVSMSHFYEVLSKYPYLAERVCWVLQIDERDAALLIPRTARETDLLVNSLHPDHSDKRAFVAGVLGPQAPASLCDGLQLPLISSADLYYLNEKIARGVIKDQLDKSGVSYEDPELKDATVDVWRKLGLWSAAGLTDEQRGKNCVALRPAKIYEEYLKLVGGNAPHYSLTSCEASVSTASDDRRIAAVDFHFEGPGAQERRYRCEVDVTGLYPFEAKPLERI